MGLNRAAAAAAAAAAEGRERGRRRDSPRHVPAEPPEGATFDNGDRRGLPTQRLWSDGRVEGLCHGGPQPDALRFLGVVDIAGPERLDLAFVEAGVWVLVVPAIHHATLREVARARGVPSMYGSTKHVRGVPSMYGVAPMGVRKRRHRTPRCLSRETNVGAIKEGRGSLFFWRIFVFLMRLSRTQRL